LVYIPGNHDEWLRDYPELQFGGILLLPETVHTTADGRRLLILHGDCLRWRGAVRALAAVLGDGAYEVTLKLNHYYNFDPGAGSAIPIGRSPPISSIGQERCAIHRRFTEAVACPRRGAAASTAWSAANIASAEMRSVGGAALLQDGDWVESCTALVEHFGRTARDRPLDGASARSIAAAGDARRAGLDRRIGFAHSGRHRCVAAAGQRRGADPNDECCPRSKSSAIASPWVSPDLFASLPCPFYSEIPP